GAGLILAEGHEIDASLLAAVTAIGIAHYFRDRDVARDRLSDLLAQHGAALVGDILRFVHAVRTQHQQKIVVAEPAGSREFRRLLDLFREHLVAHIQPELLRLLVERRLADHFRENLPINTERARLLGRDPAAELAVELLHPLGIGVAELLGRDLQVADLDRSPRAEIAENVGDAPDHEGDDQQAHEELHKPSAHFSTKYMQHSSSLGHAREEWRG